MDDASIFGVGGDAIVGVIHCLGTEAELLDCNHNRIGYHSCYERDNFVAISCYGIYSTNILYCCV